MSSTVERSELSTAVGAGWVEGMNEVTTSRTILHHTGSREWVAYLQAPRMMPITVSATTLYPALIRNSVNDFLSKR